jgi:hypothetical protein
MSESSNGQMADDSQFETARPFDGSLGDTSESVDASPGTPSPGLPPPSGANRHPANATQSTPANGYVLGLQVAQFYRVIWLPRYCNTVYLSLHGYYRSSTFPQKWII